MGDYYLGYADGRAKRSPSRFASDLYRAGYADGRRDYTPHWLADVR